VFASAFQKIGYLRPEFVMCVGDLVEGYTLAGRITDLDRIDKDWDYITALTDNLDMPFFYVVGNNDINSPAASPLWEKRFGRTHYKFIYKNVLFVSLNSDDPPGSRSGQIGEVQIQWLYETLKGHPDVRWTCIFLHRPLWRYEKTRATWDKVERVLGDRPRTVFSGHRSEYNRMKVNGFTYFTLASTGSGDAPEPPPSPVFDHIAWVTITADSPHVANLMLDGVWGDDPPTEAKSK
jgi:hypothetical protein